MPDGQAPGGGAPLPGWLGPIVTITTQVGVPTVVAGVLLWFVLFRVDTAMKAILEEEAARTQMVSAMQDSLIAALDRQTKEFTTAIEQNIRTNRELADVAHQERLRLMERLGGRP